MRDFRELACSLRMSRIVVTTLGSLGDLHPYLAIARGMRARGHEVMLELPMEPFDRAVDAGWLDPLLLFENAFSDRGVLRGLAPLIAMPLLHACRRAWARHVPADWSAGYCPICGGWPALAEIRGLDGTRHLRCGRCGSDWRTEPSRCPFCGGERDHEQRVPAIEVCDGCNGYVKTFTMLQGCQPDTVMLEDLATVHFDVAALEHGYTRPSGAGYPLEVTVTDKGAAGRFFGWKA